MKTLKQLMTFTVIAILVLTGCNKNNVAESDNGGLSISSISFGLGGEIDQTLVTYHINLSNTTNTAITVKTIEPILTDELNERLIEDGFINEVNTQINENSYEEITGSFYLDTQGLDKDGILKLNISLDKFKITTEQVLERIRNDR